MRHLKAYKIFESVTEVKELVSVLNDMALEIKDKDLSCEINIMLNRISGSEISISVKSTTSEPRFFLWEIKDVIIQMVDFMRSQNWDIHTSNISSVNYSSSLFIEGDKILSRRITYSGECEKLEVPDGYRINNLSIKFRKIR